MTPDEEAEAVYRLAHDLEHALSSDITGIVARAIGVTIGRVIYGLIEISGRDAGAEFGATVDAAAVATLDHLRASAADRERVH